jgi:hypothetical protein
VRRFELHDACTRGSEATMSATIMTVAKLAAIKAVKRQMQAKGLKPTHIERQAIMSLSA